MKSRNAARRRRGVRSGWLPDGWPPGGGWLPALPAGSHCACAALLGSALLFPA